MDQVQIPQGGGSGGQGGVGGAPGGEVGSAASRVRGWLKKWWKWLLGGLAVFASLATGLFLVFRKRPIAVGGAVELEKKRAELEAEAQAKAIEAMKLQQKEQDEARKQYTESVHKVEDGLVKKTDELVDDPDALNDYLKDIGKKVRDQ